ncbi:MAG: sulfatase-like hydrolase/transferase [Anaerolineaceae bacterium]|nr:sulfatase-like hydrolase/transferase [Anaerolineaceae bacterium]
MTNPKKSFELLPKLTTKDQTAQGRILSWAYLLTLTVLTAYFCLFMEWLFYVTKPSFMDLMPFGQKLGVFLLSGLVAALAGLPLLIVLFAVSLLPFLKRQWKLFLWLGGLLPASFLAVTILLLVDNFTYTLFKFGILNSQGIWRGVYGFLFALVWLACLRWAIRTINQQSPQKGLTGSLKSQVYVGAALLVLSIVIGISSPKTSESSSVLPAGEAANKHPNILLIGSDGVDADHMSLYNDALNNTPFLKSFSQSTLMAENNFPNVNETSGSLVSIFTGKLSTVTRTLFPPDILKGADAFQHFPGILKSQGYYNAEISVDYYADANNLNLQDSFVVVNGRSTTLGSLYTLSRQFIPEDPAYFLSTVAKAISDRVLQIYYIRTVFNPYDEVRMPLIDMNDQDRVDQLMTLFRTIHQPLFVHVHMMGTHIPSFDNYDQDIAAYDGYMKEVINDLTQMGQLDNTVIIVYTDHGLMNVTNMRIPLMIRFPNGQYAGKITNNTQNLDIAPTILDYLGIQPPSWMTGQSLLRGQPPATQPIFSAEPSYRSGNSHNELQLDMSKVKPPFYQFGSFGMVICQKWYAVDANQLTWMEGTVEQYPTPCADSSMPTDSQAKQILLNQLNSNGFDTTTLAAALSKQP